MNRKFKEIKQGFKRSIISKHAMLRMSSRNITEEAIEITINFGRMVYTKGARIFVIGKKEIKAFKNKINLKGLEGLHVVCSAWDDSIITVYINKSFKKSIRV